MRTILLVGGSTWQAGIYNALEEAGYLVLRTEDSVGLPALLRQVAPQMVIIIADEATGAEPSEGTLQELKIGFSVPVILMGSGDEHAVVRSLIAGADAYLPRSTQPSLLLSYMRALLRRDSLPASLN